MGLQILGNKLKRKRIGDQSGGMLERRGMLNEKAAVGPWVEIVVP